MRNSKLNPQQEIKSLYEIVNAAAAKKRGEDEGKAVSMAAYCRIWSQFNEEEKSMVLASAGLRRDVSKRAGWFDMTEAQRIKVSKAVNRLRNFVASSPIMEGVA